MLEIAQKHFSLILVILASLAFVGFALAHETGEPHAHSAEIDVQAGVSASGTAPRPLDLVRQRAAELKQNAGINAQAGVQVGSSERGAQGAAGVRADIAAQRNASSTGIVDRIRTLVRQHAGLVKERFSLALRHFDNLSARIESRIEKMKAEGMATASVEAELAVAKTANAEAKADVQAVADFVASVDDSDDRAQVRTQLQALVKDAQTSIRTAHQALQKVVRSLVALAKESKPAPGASASVEAEVEATNQ